MMSRVDALEAFKNARFGVCIGILGIHGLFACILASRSFSRGPFWLLGVETDDYLAGE